MTARERRGASALSALVGVVKAAAGGASEGELLVLVGRGCTGLLGDALREAPGRRAGPAVRKPLPASVLASSGSRTATKIPRAGRLGPVVEVVAEVDGVPVRAHLVDAVRGRAYRPK